jgi:tetratricopeptide (TPR) repeat protein
LAQACHSKGEYDKAYEYIKECFRLQEQCLGNDHPEVATSCNNLGQIYKSKGQYVKAYKMYQNSIEIQLKQLGPIILI